LSRDSCQGFTSIGPHRDDLEFYIDDNNAASHASRGETRSLVLALKIIEAGIAESIHGQKPVMLLDDVFSELAASRRRYLIEHLRDHQVIITTTDADAVIDHFSSGEYKIIPTKQD
jgi:DNA replication and repair protein RecF